MYDFQYVDVKVIKKMAQYLFLPYNFTKYTETKLGSCPICFRKQMECMLMLVLVCDLFDWSIHLWFEMWNYNLYLFLLFTQWE